MSQHLPVQVAVMLSLICVVGCAPNVGEEQTGSTLWKRIPTSDEIAACQPLVTELPDGSVQLRCRVGATGDLEQCAVLSATDARLGAWAICAAEAFKADEGHVGDQVEVPLRWRRPRLAKVCFGSGAVVVSQPESGRLARRQEAEPLRVA